MIPTVLIVGLGMMGSNHLTNLKQLELESKVQIVALVDADSKKLISKGIPYFTDLEEALEKTQPDIVVICTNTKTHAGVLKKVLSVSSAIFIEKPLVASSKEAEAIIPYLQDRVIACDYLFRESPVVEAAISYLKEHELTIAKVQTVWQKNRMEKGPPRPSEGVHIDEATHPIDLVVHCLLNGKQIKILKKSCKRESEVGVAIVDRQMQEALYGADPSKLDPVAEVSFLLDVDGIPVEGFSSFAQSPQRREVLISCTEGTTLLLKFDLNNADYLIVNGETRMFPAPNKLMRAWRTFLDFYETGERSWKIPTIEELHFDLQLTEVLEKN